MTRKLLLAALAGWCLACAPAPVDETTAEAGPPVEASGPEAVFAALEARLLSAESVRLAFAVTAVGAVEADLEGELSVSGEEVGLFASGTFGGEPANLLVRAGGGRFEYGNMPASTTGPSPALLGEAMLVGLTRMGILHNLARLSAGLPPDHAGGGVREWVTLGAIVPEPPPATLGFSIVVEGELAGAATLALGDNGLPVERTQTVRFPEGEMRVTERYSSVVVTP